MKALVRFEVQVPVSIFRESDVYVSHCPIFDVCSQGDTEEEAKKNIIEAVSAFLISCYENGTLDEVMKESGFVPVGPVEIEATPDEYCADYINIPLPFMIKSANPALWHA